MRYFQQIAFGVDVGPLLHAVTLRPDLWNADKTRTTFENSPHAQVDDILIRFNDTSVADPSLIIDGHESLWHPAALALPQARPLIFWLMARVEGERLGRVLITKLAPGDSITPHIDGGAHAAYYERYHIVLKSLPGSTMRAGNETVHMQEGSVWWFENAVEHEVTNSSADDRIHMIVDIKISRLGT